MEREEARRIVTEARDLIATNHEDTDSDEFNDAFDAVAPGLAVAVLTLLLKIDSQVHREGV